MAEYTMSPPIGKKEEGQEYLPSKTVRTEHHEQGKYIWDAIFVNYFVDIVIDK